MKVKYITTLACIFIFTFGTFAQDGYASRQFTSDLYLLDTYIKKQANGIDYSDSTLYTGSPYFNTSFLPGNIYKNDALLANDVALRYNAIADEMEVKESLVTEDDAAKLLTKDPDIYVKINNDIFIFAPYQGGIEKGGYFQVLHEGEKTALYKKIVKEYTPPQEATSSITRDVPARFKDKPVYYIVSKTGKFYELPKSSNRFTKVFGDKSDMMKDYVKSEKLDTSAEVDILKAVKYYDSL